MNKLIASVIIPNWNGQDLLKDCLTSLKRQTFKDFEIILVDNGSTDRSKSYVNNNFPDVKIVYLDKNYGFSKAINEGVKKSKTKYVVFLNNDTEVEKDWLKNLIKSVESHSNIISVNSKILNYYNRKKIDGVGILINEVGQAKSIGWEEEDRGQYQKEMYIFGATGGASLFNREDFIKIGYFDESYFMYSEEVDFAFRAQFLEYKSLYCPEAVVYHKHKATSKKKPQYIEYWQFRNMYMTIIKNFPTHIIFKNFRWLKIILIYLNTIIYQIKNGFFWPPVAVTMYLFFNFPRLIIQRKKIQNRKRINDIELERFFLPKKITFWKLLK